MIVRPIRPAIGSLNAICALFCCHVLAETAYSPAKYREKCQGMSLAAKLVSTPQRENSATGSRYDYQTMWGLTLLFQQHDSDEDYAIIFEFHDDVALLNNSTQPSSIRFYQVKSKATVGGWALTKLLRREPAKKKDGTKYDKPSIVDKMFDGVAKFNDEVLSVDFVSNQPSTFSNSNASFFFSECKPNDFKKIVSSIQEVNPTATEAQVGLLGFRHTDLSLNDAEAHIKGRLQTFVSKHLGVIRFSPEAVYKAIIDDCRRRANFSGSYASLSDAIKLKGLTRDNVQEWLDAISKDTRAPDWGEISPKINYPFAEELQIGNEYRIYQSVALNSADTATHRVRLSIRKSLASVINNTLLDLGGMIAHAMIDAEPMAKKYLSPFSQARLKAMIIYEIYTHSET